jgi:hypothetical protein
MRRRKRVLLVTLMLIVSGFTGTQSNLLFGQGVELNEARRLYMRAEFDSCAGEGLYNRLKGLDLEKSPVLLAYRGTARSMMARCTRGSFKKLNVFKEGKEEVERALSMSPTNWEIRYLRFHLQSEIPLFLNYRNFDEDMPMLVRSVNAGLVRSEDPWFMRRILTLLSGSDRFSEAEQKRFLELKKSL